MKKICKYCGAGYDGDPGSSACPDCVRKQRQTSIRQRICRQCGIEFPGGPRAWYCPECRRRNQALKCAAWEKANREARNQYHLARIKAKEATMAPEEYKAYRDAINARARENYRKRKEKKNGSV